MEASYYIRVMLTLGVLIGFLVILQKLTKGLNRKRFSGDIKILDRMPMDSNSSLLYVSCQKTRLLIALNSKSVAVLHKWQNVEGADNPELEEGSVGSTADDNTDSPGEIVA